jgi:hypothetical protein
MTNIARKFATENRILSTMDRRSRATKRGNRMIVALDGKNLFWREYEVEEAVEMWNRGLSVEYMAEYFERPAIEVLLILLDRAEQGEIEWRKGSIFGYEVKTRG